MRRCPACGSDAPDAATVCPACGAAVAGDTASLAPAAAEEKELAEQLEAAEVPLLVVRKGPEVGEKFFLDRPAFSIGRDPQADIFLNDVTVSRRHAVLVVAEGHVSVRDEGSLNGTYVNGVSVDEAPLAHGDALQIGRFQMIFLAGGGA